MKYRCKLEQSIENIYGADKVKRLSLTFFTSGFPLYVYPSEKFISVRKNISCHEAAFHFMHQNVWSVALPLLARLFGMTSSHWLDEMKVL